MKIFFAGTTDNAAKMLEALHLKGHEIVGVLTRTDARSGRKGELISSAVAKTAEQLNLRLFKTNAISDELTEEISNLKPDLGIVLAYGVIFGKAILGAPKHGWINLHYSLLPKYRGAAPVQHAILDGLSQTGVTLFSLDSGVDSGPIIGSATYRLSGEENAKQLQDQLTDIGITLTLETLDNFDSVFPKRYIQDDKAASFAGKISRSDARLQFQDTALALHNLVRAMNPEPMAWFEYYQTPIRVLESSVAKLDLPIGEAKLIDKQVHIGCGSDSIVLKKVQPAGKAVMDAADWFRGLRSQSISLL